LFGSVAAGIHLAVRRRELRTLFGVVAIDIYVLSSLLYSYYRAEVFFVSRSASGFFCGPALSLGVDTPLSKRQPRVIETEWGHAGAPGLRKTVRRHHLSECTWLQVKFLTPIIHTHKKSGQVI
jgi:hypothetical protein